MSPARQAFSAVVGLVEAAVAPVPVDGGDGAGEPSTEEGDAPAGGQPAVGVPGPAAVAVRPLRLERIGRSRRAGPLLDLRLDVHVLARGPRALECLEQVLVAVEREARYTASTDLAAWPGAAPAPGSLAVVIQVPVPVPVEEPRGPAVTEPHVVRTEILSRG